MGPLPRLDVSLDRLLQRIHQIGSLPAEEIAVRLAAEVAIACRGLIDRLVQPQMRADALWRKPQKFRQPRLKPGFVHRAGAGGIDIERQRPGDPARIAELDGALLDSRKSGG